VFRYFRGVTSRFAPKDLTLPTPETWVHECAYVCMYAYVYIRKRVHICVCVYMCMHVYVYARVPDVRMYVRICVCVCMYGWVIHTYVCVHVHNVYVCAYVRVRICVWLRVPMCMYGYAHVYGRM